MKISFILKNKSDKGGAFLSPKRIVNKHEEPIRGSDA